MRPGRIEPVMKKRRRPNDSGKPLPRGERRNFIGRGNDEFLCLLCGLDVQPLLRGGFRSHCPRCLWSRHVDELPGDRAADCLGLMRPIAAECTHGTWYVIHQCESCSCRRRNRLALNDPHQPDSWDEVVALSGRTAQDGQSSFDDNT